MPGAVAFETSSREKKHGKRTNEIVSGLAPLCSVPHSQIEKYMRLQDEDTVSELRDIVRKVSKGPKTSGLSALPEDEASQSSRDKSQSSQAKSGSRRPRSRIPTIEQRIAGSWRSTYDQYYSQDNIHPEYASGQKAKRDAVSHGAFKKIWKPDQEDVVKEWSQDAPEQDVQRLANACRGVFAVEDHTTRSTEYKSRFVAGDCKKPPRVERDANWSQVPLGSIYTTDPWELEASAIRTKQTRERLMEICNKQDQLLKHKVLPKQQTELVYINKERVSRLRSSSGVSACFGGVPKFVPGSEYRASYIAH